MSTSLGQRMTVELVPATLRHVLALGRQLKPELLAAGQDPRRAVAHVLVESRSAKALMVDGRVVAAYGIKGTLLAPEATIWLMAGAGIRGHLKVFVTACRAEFSDPVRGALRLSDWR
jgi:hypothetical protein